MKMKVQNLIAIGLILLIGAATQMDAQIRQRGTDRQIRTLLTSIETKTNAFKREADRSSYRGRNNNNGDDISSYISDFQNATDALKNGFNARQNVSNETTEVLNRATVIDSFIRRNRLSASTGRLWDSLRMDLNMLAGYYGTTWNWNQPAPANNASFPVYTASDPQLRSLFTRIENKTDNFKKQLDSALDSSKLNNTNREDNLLAYVSEFENSTDRLKQKFESRESVASDVSDVLTRAAYIDQFMSRNQLSRPAENQWASLRYDLNTLATYYRVSWNWNQTLPPFTPDGYNNGNNNGNTGGAGNGTGNGVGQRFDSRLTGTYRLNTSLSDNVSSVIDRSVGYYTTDQRDNMRRNLERRLASPEIIAIEKNGSSVTLASSNAPRSTFQADGQRRT